MDNKSKPTAIEQIRQTNVDSKGGRSPMYSAILELDERIQQIEDRLDKLENEKEQK